MKDSFVHIAFFVIFILYLIFTVSIDSRPYIASFIVTLTAVFASVTKIKKILLARKTWRKAQGKVKSRLVQKEIVDSEKGYVAYYLRVQVEFEVSGETYICTKIFIDEPALRFSSFYKANKYMKNIYVGSTNECFYNAKNPVESAVSLKIHYVSNVLVLLVSPVIAIICWLMLVFIT